MVLPALPTQESVLGLLEPLHPIEKVRNVSDDHLIQCMGITTVIIDWRVNKTLQIVKPIGFSFRKPRLKKGEYGYKKIFLSFSKILQNLNSVFSFYFCLKQ